MLHAGEGTADLTPPLGFELAGFHKPVGKERKITGVREAGRVRALALRLGDTSVLILVLDLLSVSAEFSGQVQQAVAKATGVAAAVLLGAAKNSRHRRWRPDEQR